MLGPGRALADIGPVHLTVQAWSQGEPSSAAATAGAQRAVSLLGDLSRYLHTARLPVAHPGCRPSDSQPEALNRMIKAVRLLNAPDFTPMAAVAGTFSDMVKEAALGAGADRVLVNNGGDIALSVERGGRPFKVGLVSDLSRGSVSGIIQVERGMGMEGVATSGFGGRSLSKGVANAVTCLADSCCLADAAATDVANATDVGDPLVERCPAEALDPLTDIKGHTVTKKVGRLSQAAAQKALANGLGRAGELIKAGMILGCIIFVQKEAGRLPLDLPLGAFSPQAQASVWPHMADARQAPPAL